MAKSKLQGYKYCVNCGVTYELDSHHCLHGTANRKIAEKYGLKVWLCHKCHMDLHDWNTELDRALQIRAQRYYESNIGTRKDFIREFGKSYI